MLEGCVPWPADLAARYRARGWREGITIPEMLARSAARAPEKTALVSGNSCLSYRLRLKLWIAYKMTGKAGGALA